MSMSRRIKLDFKPLTLSETAKALGVPPARARKILAMVGVDINGRRISTMRQRNTLARQGIVPQVKLSQDEDRSAVGVCQL